jgi:hypothetical protein
MRAFHEAEHVWLAHRTTQDVADRSLRLGGIRRARRGPRGHGVIGGRVRDLALTAEADTRLKQDLRIAAAGPVAEMMLVEADLSQEWHLVFDPDSGTCSRSGVRRSTRTVSARARSVSATNVVRSPRRSRRTTSSD